VRRLPVICAFAVLAACSKTAVPATSSDHPQIGSWGVDLTSVDTTVKPSDDFFRYVNGKWLAKAEIPPDRVSVGGFEDLQLLSEQRSIGILKDLAARDVAALSPEEQKVRAIYTSYVDTARINAAGLKPAMKDIAYFQGLQTMDDVARAIGSPRLGADDPFGIFIAVDDKHPDAYAVRLAQSGLGLPDRDYYLRQDSALAAVRTAYQKYLAAMLADAGQSDVEKRAAAVYELEHQIAEASWPAADRRDADKIYNPMTISELEKLAPQFPWRTVLTGLGIPLTSPHGERAVIVTEKSAFPKLAAVYARTPVPVWRDYFTTHYLHANAGLLDRRTDSTNFDFYGKVLSGQQQQRSRDIRAFYRVDGMLGEALGKLYVAKYFPPDAKAKAMTLVNNVKSAMADDIKSLDWMTDSTKARALEKLSKFNTKIGYPDKWRDYTDLAVDPNDLVATGENATEFEWKREIKRLDLPVDRSEWGMTPPTINAYYDASMNEIVFPAAILQPPFFDPHADDAVNYGGIGMVIGHEVSHGFDDQGSKYDGNGVLRNWWSAADRDKFNARTAGLVQQYSEYEPVKGTHVNGQLTLGENIGDLAGMTIAARAYQKSLQGKPAPVLDGYTGDQRFYLGFGQAWRGVVRDEAQRAWLLSDPHSPNEDRVNGSIKNLDGWYSAFAVEPGGKNYVAPEKRVRIW
jgi:putative endopeptidase